MDGPDSLLVACSSARVAFGASNSLPVMACGAWQLWILILCLFPSGADAWSLWSMVEEIGEIAENVGNVVVPLMGIPQATILWEATKPAIRLATGKVDEGEQKVKASREHSSNINKGIDRLSASTRLVGEGIDRLSASTRMAGVTDTFGKVASQAIGLADNVRRNAIEIENSRQQVAALDRQTKAMDRQTDVIQEGMKQAVYATDRQTDVMKQHVAATEDQTEVLRNAADRQTDVIRDASDHQTLTIQKGYKQLADATHEHVAATKMLRIAQDRNTQEIAVGIRSSLFGVAALAAISGFVLIVVFGNRKYVMVAFLLQWGLAFTLVRATKFLANMRIVIFGINILSFWWKAPKTTACLVLLPLILPHAYIHGCEMLPIIRDCYMHWCLKAEPIAKFNPIVSHLSELSVFVIGIVAAFFTFKFIGKVSAALRDFVNNEESPSLGVSLGDVTRSNSAREMFDFILPYAYICGCEMLPIIRDYYMHRCLKVEPIAKCNPTVSHLLDLIVFVIGIVAVFFTFKFIGKVSESVSAKLKYLLNRDVTRSNSAREMVQAQVLLSDEGHEDDEEDYENSRLE